MRSRFLIPGLCSLFLSAQTGASPQAVTSEVLPPGGQGLRFVPPEELRGIPLAELPYAGYELPAQVDLSAHMPPPGHQQQQNSCAAWASAYAVKTYQEKIEQRYPLLDKGKPRWQHIFSPAFVYNQINQGRDGGATLVDALNLLRERGALSWADMPYLSDNITRLPSEDQLHKARRFRIAYWRQVNVADVLEVKSQVQAGYPVMVGMLIDQGFYRLQHGVWDAFDRTPRSGHAVVLVGYDDRKRAFKVMNSWGTQWGEQGFGWISYGHFRRSAREAYVAKDAWNQPLTSALRQRPADPFGEASGGAPAQKPSHNLPAPATPPIPEEAPRKDESLADVSAVEKERSRAKVKTEKADHPWFHMTQFHMTQHKTVLSGQVRFTESFREPEVVVRFYVRSGEQYRPFVSETILRKTVPAAYTLPNGQWALKAQLTLYQEEQATLYHWTASVPEVLMAELAKAEQVYWQPVFYSDKFGVSHPDRYLPYLTNDSRGAH